jgi:hypothetical protein
LALSLSLSSHPLPLPMFVAFHMRSYTFLALCLSSISILILNKPLTNHNPSLIQVEVDVTTKDGLFRASVPSGASTGIYEATELRDGAAGGYMGKVRVVCLISCRLRRLVFLPFSVCCLVSDFFPSCSIMTYVDCSRHFCVFVLF